LLPSGIHITMDKNKNIITIKYKSKSTQHPLRSGLGLQALAAQVETPLEFDCRKSDCGICIVSVIEGAEFLSPPTDSEKDFLKAMHADANERLACQFRITGDATFEILY